MLLGWAAAGEGTAQLRNHLPSMSKKDKMTAGTPRRDLPPTGPSFAGRGRVISGGLANQLGRRFEANKKLVRGVIGPISTSNDYLNTIFVKLVSLWGSFGNHALPRSNGKSFNLLQLSSLSSLTRKEYSVCRSSCLTETKKHIHLDSKNNLVNNFWNFLLNKMSHVILYCHAIERVALWKVPVHELSSCMNSGELYSN